jgi:plasmid maintenance system antidote protein VapI
LLAGGGGGTGATEQWMVLQQNYLLGTKKEREREREKKKKKI